VAIRLSHRLPEGLEPNALTLAVRAATDLVDLTVSNPLACHLPCPWEELRPALAAADLWRYEPDARGSRGAREAVARHHGVSAEDLLLTASTSEAYAWLFKLLGDPGDRILVPSPSYPLFDWLARLEGLVACPVPAFWHEGWHQDLGAIEGEAEAGAVALVLVSPNNPTGQYLSRAEFTNLAQLCARHGMALIVDEVFADYPLEPTPGHLGTVLEVPDPPCPVFVLSGLSKVAALPQVKLGWILAHGAPARELMEPLAFLADQYLSVSASAQALAPAALALAPRIQAVILARLKENLRALDGALAAHPHLSRLPVEGGWSVLLQRPALDSAEACAERLVRERGVLVHPGHFFGLPGERFLVLSLLPEPRTFQRGLERLLDGSAL
jgi:alanine-synthesizing transaminase